MSLNPNSDSSNHAGLGEQALWRAGMIGKENEVQHRREPHLSGLVEGLDFWLAGTPLETAHLDPSEPKLQEADFEKAMSEGGNLWLVLFVGFAAAFAVTARRNELRVQIQTGELVATGYKIPMCINDLPVEIPFDQFAVPGNVDWPKSAIM